VKILAAGGAKKPEELLRGYDIDISSKKFWQEGFDYVKNQIQRLERVID
jgi:oligoendopeptidase F